MTVVDLNIKRIEKEEDNSKVSVADLLKYALHDIETGEITNPTRAVLLIVNEFEDGMTIENYRCNMSRVEEIGYLALHHHNQIEKAQR